MSPPLAAALWFNLVQILTSMAMLAIPVMAPAIALDLGVDTTLLGSFTAIVWCGGFVTMLLAGYLTSRLGALRTSQMCIAFCAFGLLCGAAGPLPLFLAAAFLLGLGHGAETPSSSHLLARITPPRQQPFIFSLKQTGVQIGGILAGFVYPALLGVIDWRSALLLVASILLLSTWLLEIPRNRFEPAHHGINRKSGPSFTGAYRIMLRDWRIFSLSILCFSFVGVQISLSTFLVSYLVLERGSSLALAGLMLAVAQAGGLVGRLLWGSLAGWAVSPRAILAAIGAAMMLCSALLGMLGTRLPEPALAVLCFSFGMTASGWNGVQISELARLVPPEAVSQVTGAAFALGILGLVLAPIVFSALAAGIGYGLAYVAMAAWASFGSLVMLPLRPAGRAHARA